MCPELAMRSNADVRLKFYQLRVVDFLAHEISLEFDISNEEPLTRPGAPADTATQTV